MDLSKVGIRENLLPRAGKEPHWQRLGPGCFLGYRPSSREGSGTWVARAYDSDSRRYCVKSIGNFCSLIPSDRFAAAKREAESLSAVVQAGGIAQTKIETVAQACKQYAELNREAEGRFRLYVYDDPIAKMKLLKLRRRHLQEWRQRLEATPALVSRRKEGPVYRPRAPASVNREMAMLRAALNKVLTPGAPGTEAAWQEPLRAIRNADRQRTLYLDRLQRTALLRALPDDAAAFVRTLCLLPLRPGAVAKITAGDFDERTRELTIGKDKSGKGRRIVLPEQAAIHFATQAASKPPETPLFTRAGGEQWNSSTWNDPIAAASAALNLPAGVTAYTLRHSTITDLVAGGLPLLAVAQVSDTSAEMIEQHYGHLGRGLVTEALEGLAL